MCVKYILTSTVEEGVPLVGTVRLLEAKSLDSSRAIACVEGNVVIEATVLDEKEYLSYWKAGLVKTDKAIITAGLDAAIVTAEVHPDLTEITFYHADTGEPIATVPVDPATHTATLQVTATTPGVIHIRAGEPTVTRLNEVVIVAQ